MKLRGKFFPTVTEVIFTEPPNPRAISAAHLGEIAAHHAAKSRVVRDPEKALEDILSGAKSDDAIFITGSLYLVGQLRHYWKQRAQLAAR